MKSFYQDKVVIVTGSTQGLGREIALQVLEWGGKVIVNGRFKDKLPQVNEIFKRHLHSVRYVHGDVSQPEFATNLVQTAVTEFGQLDVVIHNAGLSAFGNLENANPDAIKQVVDSNLTAALLLASQAIEELKKTKGSILFVSSLVAIQGLGANAIYSSAKKAQIGVAESLRKELADYGIFVGVTYLGFTKNDAHKQTLTSKGKLVSVPERKGVPVASQRESALLILGQIKSRKYAIVQSWLGKLNFIMNRFFPGLVHLILLNAYRKQKGSPES